MHPMNVKSDQSAMPGYVKSVTAGLMTALEGLARVL